MVGAEEFGAEVGLPEACGELTVGALVRLSFAGLVSLLVLAVGTLVDRLSLVELAVCVLVDRMSLVELAVGALVDILSSVGLVVVSCISTGSMELGKAWIGSDITEQQIAWKSKSPLPSLHMRDPSSM